MGMTPIGSRWTPAESVRVDTRMGSFEHVNPSRHVSRDESMLQAALAPSWGERHAARSRRASLIGSVMLAATIGAALAAVIYFGVRI